MSTADDVDGAGARSGEPRGRPSPAHHQRRHERRDDLRLCRHHGRHLQPVRVLAQLVRAHVLLGLAARRALRLLACLVYAELASHYPVRRAPSTSGRCSWPVAAWAGGSAGCTSARCSRWSPPTRSSCPASSARCSSSRRAKTQIILIGLALVVLSTALNMLGIDLLGQLTVVGVVAELGRARRAVRAGVRVRAAPQPEHPVRRRRHRRQCAHIPGRLLRRRHLRRAVGALHVRDRGHARRGDDRRASARRRAR